MPGEHTYLRTHKLSGTMLEYDVAAEEAKLQQQAASSKAGRAAKTLVKEGRLRVTLVAVRQGIALGAHSVEGDVSLQVLRGAFEVKTDEGSVRAAKGALLVLQAGVEHDARALRDGSILITASMR
jgi:quercetin dioxygenase-like cupin family protein